MTWWPNLLFLLFGAAVVVCSVGVLVTRDIVRAAVWLLLALGNTAVLYFLLGADLIGAAQLLVYVGGTLVLVVFGVMLTTKKPFIRFDTRGGDWVIGVTVGTIVLAVLALLLLGTSWPRVATDGQSIEEVDTYQLAARSPNTRRIGLYLLGIPAPEQKHLDKANQEARARLGSGPAGGDGAEAAGQSDSPTAEGGESPEASGAAGGSQVETVARQKRLIGYLLPFEIVSVHFLVVLIGAAYLARARRRRWRR